MLLKTIFKVATPVARIASARAMATSTLSTEQLMKECGADPRRWELATGKDYSNFDPSAVPKLKTEKGALIVYNTAYTLEWVLSSPPPLHAFLEPPIMVEWPEGEDVHHH